MIATITAVGVEGRAQVLDRSNAVVEVRVVDRRDVDVTSLDGMA